MEILTPYIELHVFRRRDSKIEFLVLKRSPDEIFPNVWQMVTGKFKQNETAVQAGIRELKEETALKPINMWTAPHVNSFYNHLNDSMNLLPVFVCEVSANSVVRISNEHCEFKWVEVEEAKRLYIWEGQRRSAEIIHQYLVHERDALDFTKVDL